MKKLFLVLTLLTFGSYNVLRPQYESHRTKRIREKSRLSSAIRHNDLIQAEKILAKNVINANTWLDSKTSPLIAAARSGNWDMIELLLKHGALKDAQEPNGETPRRIIQQHHNDLLDKFDRFQKEQ